MRPYADLDFAAAWRGGELLPPRPEASSLAPLCEARADVRRRIYVSVRRPSTRQQKAKWAAESRARRKSKADRPSDTEVLRARRRERRERRTA